MDKIEIIWYTEDTKGFSKHKKSFQNVFLQKKTFYKNLILSNIKNIMT